MLSSQGNVSFVTLENGRVRKCHVDQLRDRDVEVSSTPVVTPDDINVPSFSETVSVENSHTFETDVDIENSHDSRSVIQETVKDSSSVIQETVKLSKETTESTVSPSVKEYPKRVRNQVERYDPSFK